jgi:uncharacterized membrane protein YgcG
MRLTPILFIFSALLSGLTHVACAEDRLIEPPDDREFVLDFADIVSKDDTAKISETGKKLLTDTGVRLVVLTINSMAHYNNADNIQAFTRKIMDTWIEKQSDKMWTKSVMIVRAKDDKKVRIQLGGAWKHALDADVEKVMNDVLVPRFKANEVSKGLLETAKALDKLLRKNIDKASVEAADPPADKTGKSEKK